MALGPKAVIGNISSPSPVIHSFTCASDLALSRGTLVEYIDPFTVSKANCYSLGSSSTSGAFAGIVWYDKDATDGSTQISVLKEGRADLRCSGAVTKGSYVYCAGNDEIRNLTGAQISDAISANLLGPMAVGIAEETGSDTEVILVRFNK